MSDGIIVTGTATGQPAKPQDVHGKITDINVRGVINKMSLIIK